MRVQSQPISLLWSLLTWTLIVLDLIELNMEEDEVQS